MVYKYLGWGITNENGVAHLDHDAQGQEIEHSYTGVGAGEVDVVASLDNPIVDGSIVSGTYNVWDTNFGDGGVTGNTNGGFYYTQDQTVVSRQTDNTGTTVTNLTSSLQTIRVNKPNTSIDEKDWVAPLNIEFDILSYTGTLYLQLWKSNNTDEYVSVNLSNFLTGVSNPHVKVLVADGKMKVYVNDELKTELVLTFGGLFGIRLLLSNSASFKYKNFFVYGMSKDYCVVTSQNNIIGTGDDLSITGQLYLNDELALNKTLDVYKDGSKVGTASTGDTGTATYTYTGVGDGEVEFQFKYEGIVSEIYAITDATFVDIATTGKKNSNWTNLNNNIQETVGDEYTVLKSTVASSQNRYSVSSSAIPSAPFVVEFKKYNVVEDNVYIIIGSKAVQLSAFFGGKLKNATHIKFTVSDGNISVEHDGVSETTTYTYTSLNQILFQFNSSDLELWYKDFLIYPI